MAPLSKRKMEEGLEGKGLRGRGGRPPCDCDNGDHVYKLIEDYSDFG